MFSWTQGTSSPTSETLETSAASSLLPDQTVETLASTDRATHTIREFYENQRWLGTWQPPVALLDHPAWSDESGNEVALTSPPSLENPEWEVIISPSTDVEGWQYATVFKHLQYKRAGGRASQRFGDTCRRRAWRRRDRAVCGEAYEPAVPSAAATQAAAQREAEAKNKAIRGFITMVLDLLSRKSVWSLVPWDPAALFILPKTHQEIYKQLQSQAYQRQIFAADTESPPSVLHPDGSGTLLQDLLSAAVHSRAAYAFAMAAGHIDSIASYIKLQTVQPLSFNAVAGASVEANNEAVAALAGLPVSDILFSNWRNSPFRPCHYVAIDRTNRCVVISIRGTLELGDVLSDLAAHPMEVSLVGTEGWVHQGILAAASYIHCTTADALQEAAKQCPGWPVLITGHSLGGGVAALLAMLLREAAAAAPASAEQPSAAAAADCPVPGLGPVHAITVGSAAVMSESLAAACQECVISVVLGSDIIPHLSYASVEKLLLEMSEASPVKQAAQGLKKKIEDVLVAGNTILGNTNGNGESAAGGSAEWRPVDRVADAAEAETALGLAQLLATTGVKKLKSFKSFKREQAQQQQVEDQSAAASGSGVRQIPVIDLSNEAGIEDASEAVENGLERPSTGPRFVPILSDQGPDQEPKNNGPSSHPLELQANAQDKDKPSGESDSILFYGTAESDAALVGAAMAQAAACDTVVDINKPRSGTNSDPELLFPPGRLIWVFPADEDEESLTKTESGAAMDAEEAGKVANAWDEAWEGGVYNGNIISGVDNKEMEIEGSCGVNIDEAAAQVAAHGGHADPLPEDKVQEEGAGPSTTGDGVVKRKTVPVVVEADRKAFERMLIMPDMLNDHLPHRYLEALQQL